MGNRRHTPPPGPTASLQPIAEHGQPLLLPAADLPLGGSQPLPGFPLRQAAKIPQPDYLRIRHAKAAHRIPQEHPLLEALLPGQCCQLRVGSDALHAPGGGKDALPPEG